MRMQGIILLFLVGILIYSIPMVHPYTVIRNPNLLTGCRKACMVSRLTALATKAMSNPLETYITVVCNPAVQTQADGLRGHGADLMSHDFASPQVMSTK